MQPLRTKKNHATSGDKKKITQPLMTKKIMQPLGTTKKSCNLSGQKNHTISGTKKSCNLSGQKKITLSIGSIANKLVLRPPNCSKWHPICPNGSKQVRKGPNGSKLVQTFQKGLNWSKWDNQVLIRFKWIYRGPKQGSKIIENSIRCPLNPGLLGLVS